MTLGPEKSFIKVNIKFLEPYPFAPPVIKVVEPILKNKSIEQDGTMDISSFLQNGWLASFTMKYVLDIIIAAIAKED
jgi:ubiquitin-protein ligase